MSDGWGEGNELDMTDVHGEEDLQGTPAGPADGVYHLYVESVDERREKVDALKVKFGVLTGTVAGQQGKSFVEDFFDPKPSHKDGGQFARKKLIRLAKALGLITPADFGKRVTINWQDAVYRLCVAAVETYEREANGKKYMGSRVANGGMDLWGPRDDEAAGVPLDEEALKAAAEVQVNAAPRAQAAVPATNAAAPPVPAPAAPSAPRRPPAPARATPAAPAGAAAAAATAGAGPAKDPFSGL